MRDFIDLHGASGAIYRFRSWSEGASHLPVAGNYAVVSEGPKGLVVLLAGVSDDLSTARPALTRLVADQGPTQVYTRLNVARTVRIAENDDIIAHYQPPLKAES